MVQCKNENKTFAYNDNKMTIKLSPIIYHTEYEGSIYSILIIIKQECERHCVYLLLTIKKLHANTTTAPYSIL